MSWIVWAIIIVAAAVAAWFLLKVAVGASVSPHVSGKLLLKKELQKYGVDPERLGDACLTEIAHASVDVADALKGIGGQTFATALVESVGGAAILVAKYLGDEKPLTGGEPIYEALKRHRIVS